MRFMHSILMVTNKDLSGVSEPFAFRFTRGLNVLLIDEIVLAS